MVTFALGSHGRFYDLALRIIPWLRYGYTPKLGKWLKKNARSYDAVVLNGLWNYTSYGTWSALRTLDVPYYVCPHGMLDPWLKEVHPIHHFFQMIFWTLFERKVLRDTKGIFFACEEERQVAQKGFLGDGSKGYVVGYGARDVSGDPDIQRDAFFSKFPQVRGRKIILFLSRIHPKKGLDLLIQAFARCADEFSSFDLLIAGPDNVGLKTKLVRLATELGIAARIHWTGMLTGDEKWGAFRSAEFFALPSHQENFGIAVVEAMALAVPVLITNKVNIWREVESYGAGRAVVDEIEGVSEGLQFMCRLPQSQFRTMADNARKCFLEQFDLEKNAIEFLNLMTRLGTAPARSTPGVA